MTQELAPYSEKTEKRVRIDGPQVLLEPNAAQAVAVTLHELATNAAKYGALPTAKGQIELKWASRGRRTTNCSLDGDRWPGAADAFASWLWQPGNRTNDWPIERDSAFRLAPRRACLRNRFTGVKSGSDLRLGSSRLCLLRHHCDDAFWIEWLPTLIEMTSLGEGGRDLA